MTQPVYKSPTIMVIEVCPLGVLCDGSWTIPGFTEEDW